MSNIKGKDGGDDGWITRSFETFQAAQPAAESEKVAGKSAEQGEASGRKTSKNMGKQTAPETPIEKRVVAEKAQPYTLNQARSDYHKLRDSTNERLHSLDKTQQAVQERLDSLSLPPEVAKDIQSNLDILFIQYENLGTAVVSNFEYMTNVLDTLKNSKTTIEQQNALAPAFVALEAAKNGVEKLLAKKVANLTQQDLLDTKKTMTDFMIALYQCANTKGLSTEQYKHFYSNFDRLNKMISSFDRAVSVLSGTPSKAGIQDTAGGVEADKSFQKTIEGWLEDIKKGDIERKEFWTAVSAIIAVIGFAIIVTSITVAICVLTGGASAALWIVGGILGGAMLTGGVGVISPGNRASINGVALPNVDDLLGTDQEFKRILNDYEWLTRELPKE